MDSKNTPPPDLNAAFQKASDIRHDYIFMFGSETDLRNLENRNLSKTIFFIPLTGEMHEPYTTEASNIITLSNPSIVKFGNLSILYPIIASSYLWVSVFSNVFLHEPFPPVKWIGIVLIIAGIAVISR